ncbi:uncharacterized protein LOC129319512 [Prosopis cineraria]|uniref:uncharacterized protein LOC129319512 n=1 Tax=Prosopis cineraria TaxID=364024 RepID=UPI00240FD0A5|nr:uncharacterized protein LOC129319512 [Prosopis cineraria]
MFKNQYAQQKQVSLSITMYEYIDDESKRKLSYKKRKGSVVKKIRELSILCGVDAGAVVYSGPSDPQPEVWPDHEGVEQVIERCHCQARPALEGTLSREEPIQSRINKGKELLMKRREENRGEEIYQLMILSLAGKAMPSLTDWLDTKMAVEQSLKKLNWKEGESGNVDLSIPPSAMSDKLQVFREGMLTDQFQQFSIDTTREAEAYFPAATTSEGLFINKENDQHVQYCRGIGNVGDYMGIGTCETLQPSSSANPYIPTLPTSEGFFINKENDQHVQYCSGIGDMENYMGVSTYETLQPSSSVNPYIPTLPTSEGFFINEKNDQRVQYCSGIGNMEDYMDIGAYETLQPSSSANPYIPTLPTSEGFAFNVQNERLTDQLPQYGMDIGHVEDYMGIGAYEMPQHSNNANYPYVP